MENNPCETLSNGEATDSCLQIIKYSPYQPYTKLSSLSSSWFDLRVFYVRVSNFQVDDSTPEFLTLNHIPLSPNTLLEVNGARSGIYSDDGVSSFLRRDRVDKESEEATFVSTDSIRLTGSVKFEVFDKEDLILSGVLKMSNSNGFVGESKNNLKRWNMNCESDITAGTSFLKCKHITGPELSSPTIEVYVAGSFSGTPIILTKTLLVGFRKKHNRKGMLDAIPEYETTESEKNASPGLDFQECQTYRTIEVFWLQLSLTLQCLTECGRFSIENFAEAIADYRNYKLENDEDYSNMYWRRTEYIDGEDGELSWFNAGVRVGVGIGLGICLGVGIGVGLLVRTTRNIKRRIV
ncbi:hypothetical protein EZV62_021410 [Acer yangbiense]|uniref:Erythronate-4-phosphate dehydrogenase family protein n=1 Tax=Acer yangbiense TaxID=1000413 RepID=A0A5C7H5J1_9ROSI|nr:hypothetical protein EZV62_021410 [Acer yangbiense]